MSSKLKIAILLGGRSGEHEVSLISASSIIAALDKKKYDILSIGITKQGKWYGNRLDALKKKGCFDEDVCQMIVPDPTRQGLLTLTETASLNTFIPVDVVFPVLHGPYGEDGTIQGLLELADLPYVGCSVLGSAVGMDKVIQKILFKHEGIPVVPWVHFSSKEYQKDSYALLNQIETVLGYPCFVKPARLGSSIGISKANNRFELKKAIQTAMLYDNKIIVEKSIEKAREIECGVLGNDDPKASIPGEIISSNEFYDYAAKYIDNQSQTMIPADLPPEMIQTIQTMSVKAFKAVNASGLSRVDFLVHPQTHDIYLNEINTMPGFTSISMYPKLWEASGIPYSELLDQLIELALEKHKEKRQLKTSFSIAQPEK